MLPVLFSVFGFPIQSYGVSKALAALVAAWMLARAFQRYGLPRQAASSLVLGVTVWGFIGAKVYFLLEHPDQWHHLTGGFTWYGGFMSGSIAAMVIIRKHQLPLSLVAGLAAAPLSMAYAIGRVGCFLSGDGTYGKPSGLPWAVAFPNGTVPTTVPVHPTALYEALFAASLAVGLLWLGARGVRPPLIVATYLALSGAARFAVEFLRINRPALFGLTQPQLWSLLLVAAAGAIVVVRPKGPKGELPSSANLHGIPPVDTMCRVETG